MWKILLSLQILPLPQPLYSLLLVILSSLYNSSLHSSLLFNIYIFQNLVSPRCALDHFYRPSFRFTHCLFGWVYYDIHPTGLRFLVLLFFKFQVTYFSLLSVSFVYFFRSACGSITHVRCWWDPGEFNPKFVISIDSFSCLLVSTCAWWSLVMKQYGFIFIYENLGPISCFCQEL